MANEPETQTQTQAQAKPTRKLFRRVEFRLPAEQRLSIYQSMLESSHLDMEYLSLLVLGGLIALFGLLQNSAAVIIGAMLISPLMNPILSAALALLLGDGKMGKRAATVLALSVAAVVGITWLAALMIPLKQATPEILARTQPNLLDLFIAVLSGLAGTLALRNVSVAMTILPGVAIAVAVVPPLSVVGFGLSTHQNGIAGGAFLLFITNLVSIIISAAVVFRLMGFRPRWEAEQGHWKLKYRLGFSAVLLLVLSIPLFLTLRKVTIEVAIRSSVRDALNTAFQKDEGSINHLSFSRVPQGLLIHATLETTHYVGTKTMEEVQNGLKKKFGPDTRLRINQILVTEGGVSTPPLTSGQNAITGGVVKSVTESTPFNFKNSTSQSLSFVSSAVHSVLVGTSIAQTREPQIELGSSPLAIRLNLSSGQPLDAQTVAVLSSQIGSKLNTQVSLHGSVKLTGSSFVFNVKQSRVQAPMSRTEQQKGVAWLKNLQKKVSGNQLHLNIDCQGQPQAASTRELPRYLRDLQQMLRASGLKPSQWTLSAAPPAITGKSTASTAQAQPISCSMQSYQNF